MSWSGGRRLLSKHWIEERLIEIGRRKSDLADALQINRSRISELVHGRRRISVHELPTISRFLELPVTELVRLETGDPGYQPEVTVETMPAVELEDSAGRIYSATREALDAFSRHGLDEMTSSEIDTYAKVIARCATRAEFEDAQTRKQHLESKVIELKDFRAFDRK